MVLSRSTAVSGGRAREMIGDKPDADDSLTIAGNAILCHDTNVYDERDARPAASSSTIRARGAAPG